MNKDEALKMAIEALEGTPEGYSEFRALQACKEALAQPQPRLFLDLSNSNGNHPVQQEQERNFCVRCGKRLSKDVDHIHTCTPPRD